MLGAQLLFEIVNEQIYIPESLEDRQLLKH